MGVLLHSRRVLCYGIYCSAVRWKPTYVSEEHFAELSLLSTYAGFFLELPFDPEDEGDTFLEDVGWLTTDYMTLSPRR
jgi:hypothetical protein